MKAGRTSFRLLLRGEGDVIGRLTPAVGVEAGGARFFARVDRDGSAPGEPIVDCWGAGLLGMVAPSPT